MAAPTGENAILLHVCRAIGRKGRRTELWFVVKHTVNGIKVEEIFKDLPSNKRKFYFQSNCALIGSFLYVLGGQCDNSFSGTILGSRFSRRVRRLNIQNPIDGWESCRLLPCEVGTATMAVAGNSIYLFSKLKKEDDTELQSCCFYDTTTQMGHAIEFPPDCSDCKPPSTARQYPFAGGKQASLFCSAFEDGDSRGVLVPKYWKHLYLYNPDENSWKNICNFRFPKPRTEYFPHYAVFNEKLYLSFCDWNRSGSGPNIYLHVYDSPSGQYLLDIKLPRFENLDPEIDLQFHLLAIADCKLCYLWFAYREDRVILCLVKVEVLISERSVNCSQMEVDFDLDACAILNCIPFDSYPCENQEENTDVEEQPDDTGLEDDSYPDDSNGGNEKSNDTSLEECHDSHVDEKLSLVEAEAQRLHEGLECLQKEVQQLRALITSADKIPHKHKRGTECRHSEDETGVYKNLLRNIACKAGLNPPVYTTVESGTVHVPTFSCTVELVGMRFFGEPATTMTQAQKNASMAAWSALKNLSQCGSSSSTSYEEQEQVVVAHLLSSEVYDKDRKEGTGGLITAKKTYNPAAVEQKKKAEAQPQAMEIVAAVTGEEKKRKKKNKKTEARRRQRKTDFLSMY